MFYLHIANRTEALIQQLATVLQNDRQPVFTRELFLVQSQGMERVICQGLAASLGVFGNYYFWRLEALLRDIEEPVYQSIAVYLQGADCAKKRFQLARRLADCFDHYQLMRGAMIRGWQEGKTATETASEKWQMALWQRLLAQGPVEGSEEDRDCLHRTMLFDKGIAMLRQAEEGTFAPVLPHRISVFGVHTLPPVFLDYLDAFARHANVHFYLLSPCREYWGDIKSRGIQLKEQLNHDPAVMEAGGNGHPLLGSFGRQGRDLQKIMIEMTVAMEFTSYSDPVMAAEEAGRKPTLLEGLQRDLLYGEISGPLTADHSLRVVSCHSRIRELEVLHEQLLRLLDENTDLYVRQIVVMAPDIQQYAPFIPAIFHDIEHSVADRSLQLRNPAVAAFSFFLSLFSGKFGRRAVLELVQYQGVAERFAINRADIEKLVQWTEAVGIRWGLSLEQRRKMGAEPFTSGSFRAGLERLLMGYAVDCDDFVGEILPFSDFEGKQTRALGGLCQLVTFLEQTAAALQQPRSLRQWRELLLSCVDQLLLSDDSSGEAELRKLLGSLGESERFTGEQEVDFSVIETWFTARVDQSRSSSGFLRGQLTFCSMLPMRSIPFQVVCLLGLNDGVFPQSDSRYTFDLLSVASLPGDRSPAHDDRYQFLEAILAARHTLYLSYIGQSEKSGEQLPPSVVIAELLDILEREYGVALEVAAHPLYPFDSRYFLDTDSSLFFSYSQENLDIARIRQKAGNRREKRVDSVFPWWRGTAETGDERVLVSDLISFYKNPPAWFITRVLGLSFKGDTADSQDRELFSVDALTRYQLDNGLFTKVFYQGCSWRPEKLLRYFQEQGRWPLGAAGRLAFHSSFVRVQRLIQRAEALNLGEKRADVSLALEPGDETAWLDISGRVSGRYQSGNLLVFAGRLKGWHLFSAWITHLLDNFHKAEQEPRPTWLLTETDDGCFSTLPVEGELRLVSLLKLWQEGCRTPLPLYTEPAFAWAKAAENEAVALKKAGDEAEKQLGYMEEWKLLLGGKEIRESVEDPRFHHYAETVVTPLFRLFQQGVGS